jgi:mRNA-capping enzyme
MDLDPTTDKKIPRFLIYDIIQFESQPVGKNKFNIRLACIDKEIIFARNEAIKQGKLNKTIEPFSIRQKGFFPIIQTKKVIKKYVYSLRLIYFVYYNFIL